MACRALPGRSEIHRAISLVGPSRSHNAVTVLDATAVFELPDANSLERSTLSLNRDFTVSSSN